MDGAGLSERDASARMQRFARERNVRLAAVARRIVEQESLFAPESDEARCGE